MSQRALMLVSARADAGLRGEVAAGARPCPEYLRLERDHGVQLLDWSQLPGSVTRRSAPTSFAHVRAALRDQDAYEVIFSDGEHLGIPLGLRLGGRRHRPGHLCLGHHLTTGLKPAVFRFLRPQRGIDRLLVHARRQLELAERGLRIPPEALALVPYFTDDAFWRPRPGSGERLVVAAGREHRDYALLARAGAGLDARFLVAAGSLHSPRARWTVPPAWPANFECRPLGYPELRDRYAEAALVVIPVLPTDFQAGVTSIIEAMAMGRAVITTATEGRSQVIEDGVTGLLVPPSDPAALRDAVRRLLDAPAERVRLGDNARAAVERDHRLDLYAERLAGHLSQLTRR